MLKFIQNLGDYFSSNYFDEDFTSKVLARTGYSANDIKGFNKQITPLKDKYFRFKQLFIEDKLRTKDKISEAHKFHTEVLNALGYDGQNTNYNNLFHLSEQEVIPIRHILYRGDKPHLMIMEMQALIKEDDADPDGLFEQRYNVEVEEQTNPPQRYHRSQWSDVFTVPPGLKISPVVINKAISQLFLLEQHLRPKYILLLAGNIVFLLEQEKWFRGSYLQIDLEELFSEATANRNANYYALFYFLLAKETLAPESNMVLLDQLDEDSHKIAYEVTKDLKEGIIHAVEALANEALYYKKERLRENFDETDDILEQQVKDDCLKIIYRLLFIFYAESREDLDILPSNDSTYQRGYSLEMLRDLEQVPLYSDSSLNGYFFHESLNKLFHVLSSGYREKGNGDNKSFKARHIDSPLFNNAALNQLATVKFRNKVWQDIICRLSLSKQQRGKSRGRISYANLGINQLGSVYESLLAYRGFYAEQDYIEVHKANEPNEGTYLVPRSRRDDFEENEILKDDNEQAIIIKKGAFIYRLSGRDRQKSASYYTPEVLTQCTVKYTLKPILERLDKGEMKAIELLELKLLEPAMGAAAFQNEMINQLAEAYLSYRQEEYKKSGKTEWKVQPDKYKEELQKVKAYIATNNVYGVDLNPTAIELGKLSLWLNVIHKNMETPFFSNRLAVGNAVVGAWLKVYKEKDLLEEYEIVKDTKGKDKRELIKKEWWETTPRQLEFKPTNEYAKIKNGRKHDEFYHFVLPDKNMVASANIKILKEEYDKETKNVAKWRKDWIAPLKKSEIALLRKICDKIDDLLVEYYRFQRTINLQTSNRQEVFGATKQGEAKTMNLRTYDEKEKLSDQRNRHNAPYFKLKMVMDYWCSLWFWDLRQAVELPDRQQYWQDISNILELDLVKGLDGLVERKGQQKLYETSTQLSMVMESESDTRLQDENAIAEFSEVVVKYANRKDLFDDNQRFELVSSLAKQYFFFHPQLEFLEVFWERGGFDLIAGNPPWLNIEFDETGLISEIQPEVVIRKTTSPQVQLIGKSLLGKIPKLPSIYFSEITWAESTKKFVSSVQNASLLQGQKTNLYKLILLNSFSLSNREGFIGLLHPDGVFDDPQANDLRKFIYTRLKYHFQFKNELMLFSEIDHHNVFSINIYCKSPTEVNFYLINNLFHPATIDSSFSHSGFSECGGIKIKSLSTGKLEWNINPHKDRIIKVDSQVLNVLSETFEQSEYLSSPKLVSIHSNSILQVYSKISAFKGRISEKRTFITDCWNETNSIKDGVLKRETIYPRDDLYGLVLSGPHFYVSNPLSKNPRENVRNSSDYDAVQLMYIEGDFVQRTNFVPLRPLSEFKQKIHGLNNDWFESYRIAFSKMLNLTMERTLQAAIIPLNVSHSNSVISIQFENRNDLIEFAGICSSLLLDFYIKTLGKDNLYSENLQNLLIGINELSIHPLFNRTLQLNCLNKYYAFLWKESWKEVFKDDSWSKEDARLKPFKTLTREWKWNTTLRNYFERRQALVEIDVIIAMALKLTLEELILIYKVQFPVLQQNEDDTWYDVKGNIVFTCSKGLGGVGVDRSIWDQIRSLRHGETYEYAITKSELYLGKKIVYHAPFDRCDRVEDYKIAWGPF